MEVRSESLSEFNLVPDNELSVGTETASNGNQQTGGWWFGGSTDKVTEAAMKEASLGNYEFVTKLVDLDLISNYYIQDGSGNTIVHTLISDQSNHLLRKVLEKVDDKEQLVNLRNKEGNTAAHMAVVNGNTEMVKMLVSAGLNLSIVNDDGFEIVAESISEGGSLSDGSAIVDSDRPIKDLVDGFVKYTESPRSVKSTQLEQNVNSANSPNTDNFLQALVEKYSQKGGQCDADPRCDCCSHPGVPATPVVPVATTATPVVAGGYKGTYSPTLSGDSANAGIPPFEWQLRLEEQLRRVPNRGAPPATSALSSTTRTSTVAPSEPAETLTTVPSAPARTAGLKGLAAVLGAAAASGPTGASVLAGKQRLKSTPQTGGADSPTVTVGTAPNGCGPAGCACDCHRPKRSLTGGQQDFTQTETFLSGLLDELNGGLGGSGRSGGKMTGGARKQSKTIRGIRSLKMNDGKAPREDRLNRMMARQSNKVHKEVLDTVMKHLKLDESNNDDVEKARDYKAVLWSMVKNDHADLTSNLDQSNKLLELTTIAVLKKIDPAKGAELRTESRKRRDERRKEKEGERSAPKSETELSATSSEEVPADANYSQTSISSME
jgi:hypothetical protein